VVAKVERNEENEGHAVPPQLQAAWLLQLRGFYDTFNWYYLKLRLEPPLFRLGFGGGRLGEWDPENRTITISVRHILEHSWESVLETLRHEMAHQYVHEVLCLRGAPPHGEAFERACQLLRCDPSSRAAPGRLGDLASSPAERDRILQRIKELLALAGSPNEHEAASAMRMANKYLLKYNLDLSALDGPRHYETRCLGKCAPRIQEYEHALARLLEKHFFVQVLWLYTYDARSNRNGRILEILGRPENLEMAEYVHRYVMGLTEPLWQAHRRAHGPDSGTRLQYLAGLLRGLEDKLDEQRRVLKEEQGLIWLGDAELTRFYRHLHPHTCRVGGGGVSRGAGYYSGMRDGRGITIRRGVTGGAANRGRLLPGGG
jgi:hypothetical protein